MSSYVTRLGNGYDFTINAEHQYAFTAVGVANGGVLDVQGDALTVSGLVIDASLPAGTISNVVFAASGTLDLQNAEISAGVPLELPGDFSNLSGVENISGWSVTMDGEAYRSRKIMVKNGRLNLYPRGLGVSIR